MLFHRSINTQASTMDFKSKLAAKPEHHQLRTSKLTELEDKFQAMQVNTTLLLHLESIV